MLTLASVLRLPKLTRLLITCCWRGNTEEYVHDSEEEQGHQVRGGGAKQPVFKGHLQLFVNEVLIKLLKLNQEA